MTSVVERVVISMKVIMLLLLIAMLLAGFLQPALAQEAENAAGPGESEPAPPPAMLQTTPLESCPIEACPAEGTQEGILPVKPTEIPATRVGIVSAEYDHPLYLVAVMLYPVGWLAKTVIVKPILFVFDHPFAKSSYECPPQVRLQPYGPVDAENY